LFFLLPLQPHRSSTALPPCLLLKLLLLLFLMLLPSIHMLLLGFLWLQRVLVLAILNPLVHTLTETEDASGSCLCKVIEY